MKARFWKSHFTCFVALFLLVSCTKSVVPNFYVLKSIVSSWAFIDGGGSDGNPPYLQSPSQFPVLAGYNNNLYLVSTGSSNGGISTFTYNQFSNSSFWNSMGSFSGQALNVSAVTPTLTVNNNQLYSAWIETKSAGTQQLLQSAVLNGNVWVSINGGGSCAGVTCLNATTTNNAASPALVSFNGTLYLFWTEDNGGGIYQIHGQYYNGAAWTPIPSLVNRNITNSASNPQAVVYNSEIYITWNEIGSGLHIDALIGPSTIINVDSLPASQGLNANLVVLSHKLYASWIDPSLSPARLRMAVYNGQDSTPSWNVVDGGLGVDSGFTGGAATITPRMAVFYANILYIIWVEFNIPANLNQVQIAVYNGNDNNPSWSPISGPSGSLDSSLTSNGIWPSLAVVNGNIYATWEEPGPPDLTRVVVGH